MCLQLQLKMYCYVFFFKILFATPKCLWEYEDVYLFWKKKNTDHVTWAGWNAFSPHHSAFCTHSIKSRQGHMGCIQIQQMKRDDWHVAVCLVFVFKLGLRDVVLSTRIKMNWGDFKKPNSALWTLVSTGRELKVDNVFLSITKTSFRISRWQWGQCWCCCCCCWLGLRKQSPSVLVMTEIVSSNIGLHILAVTFII